MKPRLTLPQVLLVPCVLALARSGKASFDRATIVGIARQPEGILHPIAGRHTLARFHDRQLSRLGA